MSVAEPSNALAGSTLVKRITGKAIQPALFIFAVALVLRLAWVATLPDRLFWPDEQVFADGAHRLVAGEGYTLPSARPPAYPVFLSAVFLVFGESLLVVRFIQSVLGAVTCLLVMGIATRLLDRRVGWISGALLACYPPYIYLAGSLYSEGYATFWGALTVWLAIRAFGPGSSWQAALLTGLALGVTALTRSVFLLWLPCFLLAGLIQKGITWPDWFKRAALLLGGSVLVIAPWTARNFEVYGRFVPVGGGFYYELWRGNSPLSRGDEWDRDLGSRKGHHLEIWNTRSKELSENERQLVNNVYAPLFDRDLPALSKQMGDTWLAGDQLLRPHALAYIKAHPWRCFQLSLRRLQTLYSPFTRTNTRNEHTHRVYRLVAEWSFYPVLACALVGLVMTGRQWRRVAILYLLIASITAIHMALLAATRYRLPIDSYLVLLAAVPLAWLTQRRNSWRTDRLATASTGHGALAYVDR